MSLLKRESDRSRSIDYHLGKQLLPTDPFYANGYYTMGTTMTFAGIVTAQVGNMLACRTNRTSIFKTGLKSNKWI